MSVTLERYQLDRPAIATITSSAQHRQYYNALVELEARQEHLSDDDKKYARVLAALIEKYERERFPIHSSPVEVLTELMGCE
jgi:antitoxin component HigA of HigAB toxin-antitoxin module